METIAKALVEKVTSAFSTLSGIDDAQASAKPSAGEWSKKEIVGHLIDSAANNHQRFVRTQTESPLAFPPYAQEDWVRLQAYNACPWRQLLDLWKAYNLQLAWVIRQIPTDASDRLCKLGDQPPVTLAFLVEDYLRHMKVHLDQLGL